MTTHKSFISEKITNLWEYTCVFWCEDGAVFSDETGIGNKELGEILVGVVCPDLGLELCLALPWVGWELLLCEGGKSGCACRELWLIACGMGKIDVFVVEGNLCIILISSVSLNVSSWLLTY